MLNTYKSLCTEYYDLDKPHAPEDELAFYLRFALEANGPILEPMCGTGRFLIPLLERGLEVDGVDASPQMLKVCRNRCEKKNLKTSLHEQLLTRMELGRKYNLIIMPAGSFGLLTERTEAVQGLQILYQHLNRGGKLVFEIETLQARPKIEGVWNGAWVERPDGSKLLLSTLSHFHEKLQILNTICRYELVLENRIKEIEVEDFKIRLYGNHELDDWLQQSGFEQIVRLKAFSGSPPNENDGSIVYVCEKN